MRKGLIALLLLAGCGGQNGDNPAWPPDPTDPNNICTATLDWAPPTGRMDTTPLRVEELQKFTIYINDAEGMEEARITMVIDLTDVYLIQWEIRNLPAGRHWFYMTVTDLDNLVSAYSNELTKVCI